MDVRHALLVALAATPLTGCPSTWNCSPRTERFELDEPVTAEELDALLLEGGHEDWASVPCEFVCGRTYEALNEWFPDEIRECSLTLPDVDTGEPGEISCSGTGIEHYCRGRRPLGHVEDEVLASDGMVGRTLAQMAHLEAASVLAFEQLVARLEAWQAPAELVERCRQAADDERNHARWMTALARSVGASVPPVRCETVEATPYAEALHNAVEGCVNETFAALLMLHRARVARDPLLRSLFERIAADEAGHAQLAWDLHTWLRTQLSPEQARTVDAARARALALLPARASAIASCEPGMSTHDARALARSLVTGMANA